MKLERQLKIALDESRLLILGAQVLFGFQFNGIFQQQFESLPLSSRVALASTSSALPRAAAESILEIDRMRNRLVHSTPAPGKPIWDVSGAAESIPPDVYDRCLRKGFEAAQSLTATLRDAAQE